MMATLTTRRAQTGNDRTNSWDFLHYLGVRNLGVNLGIATLRYFRRHGKARDLRVFQLSMVVFYTGIAALLW